MSNISTKLVRVMAENAKKELLALKEMAENKTTSANHTFETILSTHNLGDAMEIAIQKYKINLVVMGTKGATKATEIVFGSNTVNIINKIQDCPVLAVPEDFNFTKPEQIAFPTDFNRFYGDELLPLKQFATLYNSKIRVVHINNEGDFSEVQDHNLDQLKASLENFQHSFHWMPDTGKKEHAIKNFITEHNINILVMINYEHSFIEDIIKEPVIKKLGFQLTIPFLVIPCLE